MIMVGISPILVLSQSNAEKIQGSWRLNGTNGKVSWFLEWTFKDGDFTQTGYPPISQKGKFRIIDEKGVQLKLELFDQDGTLGKENRQIIILIDEKRKELTIDRKSGFVRKNGNPIIETSAGFLKKFGLTIDEKIPVSIIEVEFPKEFINLPWVHYASASMGSGFNLDSVKGSSAKIYKFTLVEKNKNQKGEFTKFAFLVFKQNELVGAWWSDSSPSAPNINSFRK